MKKGIMRSAAQTVAILLLLATCQSPVGDTKQENKKSVAWIEEMTINKIRQGYAEGRFTITEVVQTYLDRINEIDMAGPGLN